MKENNLGYLTIGLPVRYDPKLTAEEQPNTFETYRNYNYQKIKVKPDRARKNSKYFVSKLKELQAKNIENTGLEFILNDANSYDDFISILNDIKVTNQERYGVDLDKTGHIFVLVNETRP